MPTATDRTSQIVTLLRECAAHDKGLKLYAILDPTRDERILPILTDSGCDFVSLYPPDVPKVLTAAAPHLVSLPARGGLLDRLVREGWGNSWGVFLSSSGSLAELRVHFRQFIKAKTEDGEKLLFRFYDPRVLRVYLPTCNAKELTKFFGPVRSFVLEDDDPETALRFYVDDGELGIKRVSLDSTSGGPSVPGWVHS